MEILTYVQARGEIKGELSEEQIRRILTISGRAKEWIGKIANCVNQSVGSLPEGSDVEIVEVSGMGREILQQVPREEWVYLVNPSLATAQAWVVRENIVVNGKLFSLALGEWLASQEIGLIFKISEKKLTSEEAKIVRLLWQKQESVVEREEIAQVVWGAEWAQKYSDWGIDALMHRVRAKLSGKWQLVTIKGRGYMLASVDKPTQAPKVALSRGERVYEIPGSIYPSDEYLKYMNDPTRVRKVYLDLFRALRLAALAQGELTGKILCVNSYSYDNVDAIVKWAPGAKVYFAHYDPRAIEMHQERIKELGVADRVESWHDDLRDSKLKDASFEIVINDFRLNFNQDDQQNLAMMKNTWRVLKPGGIAIISTVVDGKYENVRYGVDQEKAPINAKRPGQFQGDEHLVRRAWSVPYWRQLFGKVGFSKVQEFDIEEGKRWGAGLVSLSVDPWSGPFYRRWVIVK
jgi:DNA-binding winged helix-turn-helix (wHTH) protein/SAM-dependent methyltransferase